MNWPRKILVPFDGSNAAQEAFKSALALARKGAVLRGLFVMDRKVIRAHHFEELAGLSGIGPNPDLERQTRQALQELGKDLLGYFERACAKAKVSCETTLTEDTVAEGILSASSATDLIVMGRRGAHPGPSPLGSNADSAARHAKVPVLIVPNKARPIRKIAAAYDGSRHGAGTLGLADLAAAALGASITLVHASEDKKMGERVLDHADRLLKTKTSRLLLSGAPEEALPQLAHSTRFDLLVMGAYGHGYIREFLLGSLTDLVLRETRTPLLIHH